ncbi:MAG TPA: hypothetical protein VH589_20570 [Trebonia sp.]
MPSARRAASVSRRDWQKAIRAELAYAPSARDRAFLMLGAVRVALLPPPGLTRALDGCRRATAFATAAALVAWIPLGAALYLNNVVFPSPPASPLSLLAIDAYVLAALMAAGVAARRGRGMRGGPRPAAMVIAGIAAGVVIAALSVVLVGVIGPGATVSAPGVLVFAPVFGAILAPLGAALSGYPLSTR